MNQKLIDDLIKIAGENIDEYPEAARWIVAQALGSQPKASRELPDAYSVEVNNIMELKQVSPDTPDANYGYPTNIRNDGNFGEVQGASYSFAEWKVLAQ